MHNAIIIVVEYQLSTVIKLGIMYSVVYTMIHIKDIDEGRLSVKGREADFRSNFRL